MGTIKLVCFILKCQLFCAEHLSNSYKLSKNKPLSRASMSMSETSDDFFQFCFTFNVFYPFFSLCHRDLKYIRYRWFMLVAGKSLKNALLQIS
jgi:hypothetical protein